MMITKKNKNKREQGEKKRKARWGGVLGKNNIVFIKIFLGINIEIVIWLLKFWFQFFQTLQRCKSQKTCWLKKNIVENVYTRKKH